MNLIVAYDLNGLIGCDNKLIWHFKKDLRFFKEMTLNKTIIMGKNCFDSIGHELKNRRNIILSKSFKNPNLEIYNSKQKVLNSLKQNEEIFVIGGSQIYELFENEYTNLYITIINKKFECLKNPIYFPNLDLKEYKKVSEKIEIENDVELKFVKFEKNELNN